MSLTREQKKAKLMARLEKAVEELLDWEEETEKPNLTQIEDIVLKLRKQVGEEMADEIIGEMGAQAPVPGPACPECGREMRYKGRHGKHLESRAGELAYERGYYACPDCDEGFFPPG